MKQLFTLLVITFTITNSSFSQCDKKYILTATGVEILDDQNQVRLKDTQRITTIQYNAKTIEIISEQTTLYGTIDSMACNWKLPLKDGQTFIRAKLNYENGEQWVTKFTITGKDGKFTLLVDIEHPEADIMRFELNRFEEMQ